MDIIKKCTKCNLEQSLSEFNSCKANKDGLTYNCKKCISNYHRNRYNDPKYRDYQRDSSLRAAYGISLNEYRLMLDEQNAVCAICGGQERRLNRAGQIALLCVDHCHDTDQIRGLLCSSCNCMLGYARDNISVLAKAIDYLVRWEGSN